MSSFVRETWGFTRTVEQRRPTECSGKNATNRPRTIGQYFREIVVPWWNRKLENGALKPSTLYGYQKQWRLYLQPKLDSLLIGQFTTVHAGRLLDGFALKGLNANCISHIRNVASEIFAHATTNGVIPVNPFVGARMLEAAKPPKPTYKYTLPEIHSILLALKGNTQSQVAVGLTFFAGLRPGEARAVRWENYDGARLKIEHSVWRKHETTPKTRESVQSLPVAGPLRLLLDQLRDESGNPNEGYILRGSNGAALNLDHLARVTIKPLLKLAGLEWHGYYAGRRGLATVATNEVKDPTGAAGMLRHKGIATTALHYIGLTEAATARTLEAVEILYEQTGKQLASGGE